MLTRLVVHAPGRRLDVAFPAHVPVVSVLPVLLRRAGDDLADSGLSHDGWVLRSVKGREATLEKNKRTATLTLPAPITATVGETASLPVPPPPMAPPPGAPVLPRPPGPAGAALPGAPRMPAGPPPPAGAPNPHSIGAPTRAVPGDPRPLADQL